MAQNEGKGSKGSKGGYRYLHATILALLLGIGVSVSAAFAGFPANSRVTSISKPPIQALPTCIPSGVYNGSIAAEDPTQTNRLFRDDPGSTCAVPQTCAQSTGTFRYDSYTLTNSSAAAVCVSITLDPQKCTGTSYLQSAAYLGSFNPANICQNYLGDIGTSPEAGTPKTYSVTVPANSTFEVVVNESFTAGCPAYTLTITGLPGGGCPSPTSTATNTATATSTVCPVQFNDVPATNTFYSSVRCLACRGIVSGYSDGTFRPNNQVTRGQLAKMVSNAAGFSEPVSGQTFEDVPPSNTFYEWIQRLSTRGYMSGYNCGGPGEPCITGSPYFRPFANATRGQTSKIVSNAAGFVEPVSGQTFQDVPTTYTFYEFIQRLATRGVMGGYNCGGVGEPCIGPENRPYFRPQLDVTRGQSAKIVANAFYPDCLTP